MMIFSKFETVYFSETLVPTFHSTRRHIAEYRNTGKHWNIYFHVTVNDC